MGSFPAATDCTFSIRPPSALHTLHVKAYKRSVLFLHMRQVGLRVIVELAVLNHAPVPPSDVAKINLLKDPF
jgi:hypothetical protein